MRAPKPWAALLTLSVGTFMFMLDATIVSIAVPTMLRELSGNLNAVVWVTSVYLLASVVPMLVAGKLGDRFGPKRVFMVGLASFTAASLWCGMAGDVGTLIAARAAQGVGAALMTPAALAYISHLFPPARRGAAMGVWSAIAGLTMLSGPVVGGVLVSNFGWPWIFYVNVPVGIVALVLALFLVPDWRPGNARSFDLLGGLLSGAGLLLFVFGLHNAQQYAWGEIWAGITIVEVLVTGAVLLAAFVAWQRFTTRDPLVPPAVFANRNFSLGALITTAYAFSLTGMFFPLVIYIQTVLGVSPAMAGLVTAPIFAASSSLALLSGWLSDRLEAKYLLMFGLIVLAGGLVAVAGLVRSATTVSALVPALLVCGVGMGFVFSPISNLTMGSVPQKLVGAASGIFNTVSQVGSVLGSAVVGGLLQARIAAAMTSPGGVGLSTAVRETLWLPVGVLLLGALLAAGMERASQVAESR
ncbi:DHA2 family efflux MFS transporter permease subunit [Amycolatopsis sp. NPDC049868]|uniref:DHA2 family efflux MFS transporter permease subunit n=1 Tax=Amycolatopsis sp. NPDC049868 TaxID=3363934 RepID=UPI0037ABC990